MKRIAIFTFCIFLIGTAHAQSEGGHSETNVIKYGLPNSITSPRAFYPRLDSVMNNMAYQSDNLYKQALYLNPNLKSNSLIWNYDNRNQYNLGKNLSLYNQRISNLGLGDINNRGVSLRWQPLKRLSIEGSGFVSMQYGYTLFSRNAAYGASFRLNYDITNKLHLNMWGQYILHQNNDPFMRYINIQPKSGVGIGLEYNTLEKVTFSIGVGKQEDVVDKKKFNIMVEGKAGIKF